MKIIGCEDEFYKCFCTECIYEDIPCECTEFRNNNDAKPFYGGDSE